MTQETNSLTPDPGVAAYGRLSRTDEKDRATPLETKIALRKDILKTLARQEAHTTLTDEQITFELKSGGSLTERPGLLSLLDRCRRKEIHTLILFDIDRITRDVGDWKTIESALYKGEIRLVTGRGTYHFTPQFDSTMLQILAVLGEKELRSFAFRRKATNAQRARAGQKSGGGDPFGYLWEKEHKVYVIDPLNCPTLVWMFSVAFTMSARAIAAELNRRGVPTPQFGKRADAASAWSAGTVLGIFANPFYTGRPALRSEVDRDGVQVDLPRARWIWAESDLLTPLVDESGEVRMEPLPHPLSRDAWEMLQETIEGRRRRRANDGPGLLNRLVRCHKGEAMYRRALVYQCHCCEAGVTHRNHAISAQVIETSILASVCSILDALTLPRVPAKPASSSPSSEIASAKRKLREKESTRQDLIARASWYHSLPGYGVEGHRRSVETLSSEIQTLQERLTRLEVEQRKPDFTVLAPLIDQVRQMGGASAFFSSALKPSQQMLLKMLILRIDLDKPADNERHTKTLRITYHALPGRPQRTETVPALHPFTGKMRGPYKRKGSAEADPDLD